MTSYPSNLSSSQWQYIAKFLDVQKRRKYDLKEVVNAILYLVKSGCQWCMLPADFPNGNWFTIILRFGTAAVCLMWFRRRWWKKTKQANGKSARPSVGIIDAQSVKSSVVSSQQRGFDAGMRVMGIKPPMVTDTLGLVLMVVIIWSKLVEWAKQFYNFTLLIIKRDKLHTFKVLPKRWIVERAFAWIDANRRTSKNYERLTLTSKAIVQVAAIKIMIYRF